MNSKRINLIIIYFLLLLIFCLKIVLSELKDYYSSAILENENNYLVDVKDYHNISIIITTSKNIYTGIPPVLKSSTNANIYNCSSAATYNEKYILIACLSDSLLSKININTGQSSSLLDYSDINVDISQPTSICSITIYEKIIFLFISQPINENSQIQNLGIKLYIKDGNENIGPIIDSSYEIKTYNYPEIIPRLDESMRQISCEALALKGSTDFRLVCANEFIEGKKYRIYFFIINNDFNGLEVSKIESNGFDHPSGIQLFRINKYYIRCLMRNIIFDKYLKSKNGVLTLAQREEETELIQYNTNINLYGAHNNFVFSAKYGYYMKGENMIKYFYFAINKIKTSNYFKFFDYSTSKIIKIITYYNEQSDSLIFVGQYLTKIKYFTLIGIKGIFDIISYTKINKISSNTETLYNISDLIESAIVYAPLSIEHSIQYIHDSESIANYYEEGYTDFPIDSNNHLYIYKSDNNWIDYYFGFIEFVENDMLAIFYLPNAKLIIQTCNLQCADCPDDYDICGLCRNPKYAILNGDENDHNCYPINQMFSGYIYSPVTKKFEKCYISCKFCSLMGSLSTPYQHNCKVCADGYYPSYKHLGNCYKINSNEINNYKYVADISNESFSSVNSCSEINREYAISSTKECIEKCPFTTPYYSYIYTFINFNNYNEDEEIPINQFILNSLLPPKYEVNSQCYEECPESNCQESINECQYGWHQNISNAEIECYTVNYCLYNEYRYYIDDTKECKSNGCPDSYYQHNFQCYKNSCPPNTNQPSTTSYKCESIYDYCYVNENFQTICSQTQNNDYNYNYDNSNQYLKDCSDSLIYTIYGAKTYLYNNTCYLECPKDITNIDEENFKCVCKYYGYYIDENNYICYNEEEICKDKIPVVDIRQCEDSINSCINKEYKIFNNKCYKDCPRLTKLGEDGYSCKCKYSYYNDINTNIINCFEEIDSCENNNYLFSNPETNECFSSLEDCFTKNNLYYFNNYCYKDSCPSKTISFSSITNDLVKTNLMTIFSYLTNSELTPEMCICDIINYYWTIKFSNGINLIQCLETCEENYSPDLLTHRCIDKCDKTKHYIFNDICYISGCPEGTQLDPNDSSSRVCKCEDSYYTENNIIICCTKNEGNCPINESNKINNIYPKEYYENPSSCLAVYNNKCYLNCPEGTKLNENDINSIFCFCQHLKYIIQPSGNEICLFGNELCPEDLPYEIILAQECVEFCSVNELINNTCRINNIFGNLINITQNIKNLVDDYNYINDGTEDDIIILGNNIVYEIVTSKKNNFNNISSYIDFGECEAKLKEYYNIDFLLIFKYDIKVNYTNPTMVQYEVFNPYNKSKLDLSICEQTEIDIYIPTSLSEEDTNLYKYMLNLGYDILNMNDDFYNDICTTYTDMNSSTDITLSDRRKTYFKENYTFCEENCEYAGFDLDYNTVKCECSVKTDEIEVIKFDKNDLSSYFNIKTYTNFEIVKCFKLVFSKIGQKLNYGSYILLIIIAIFLFSFGKYIYICNTKINEVLYNAYNYKINNTPPKKKGKIKIKKRKSRFNSVRFSYNMGTIKDIFDSNLNSISITSKQSSSKIVINNESKIKDNDDIKVYSKELNGVDGKKEKNCVLTSAKTSKGLIDAELNTLDYPTAKGIDKRKFVQYYFSLLQKGHILLLTFLDYNDFNIMYIKLILFLFYSSLFFIVNALFFTDKTMNRIYEDKGAYSFINKLPQLIYSSLITSILNISCKYLALMEREILKIRKVGEEEYDKESKKVIKCIKIKFSIFLGMNILFLVAFWYYISAFCAVYKNTQIILIKDTLISFAFSFLYPLIIYLIPGTLRFISLRNKDRECLYKLSIIISKV